MKKIRLITIALLLTLSLSSSILAGCAGCGTTNDNNMNDMVESTPADTEEGILEAETGNGAVSETPQENGGNMDNNDISNNPDSALDENAAVDDNANLTDSNGNPIVTDGNGGDDAGNVVGDAAENVGNAAKDVVDGVGNGVKSLVN